VAVAYDAGRFTALAGNCPAAVTAPGSARFELPAFGWAVCRVEKSAL
jgi:neopullulanase